MRLCRLCEAISFPHINSTLEINHSLDSSGKLICFSLPRRLAKKSYIFALDLKNQGDKDTGTHYKEQE